MTYGYNKRFDEEGEVISKEVRPSTPEIYRKSGIGGLRITPVSYGMYVKADITEGGCLFHRDDLPDLAAYFMDLWRRLNLPIKETTDETINNAVQNSSNGSSERC